MIASGAARDPKVRLAPRGSAKVVGVEFVETRSPEAETGCGHMGQDFVVAECAQDFADQRSAETARELAIVLFMTARMTKQEGNNQCGAPALRAFRRPSLRSGLLQARRAGGVRLCSRTCPGLLAHCSPLLAPRQKRHRGGGGQLTSQDRHISPRAIALRQFDTHAQI